VSVVVIESTESVEFALRKLAQHNIYSAPVVDSKTQKPLGLIDVTDIATSLVQHMATRFKVLLGQGMKSVEQFSLTAIQRYNELDGVRQAFLSEPALRVMSTSVAS
jgi:predicted transcriptional regulator